MEINSIDELAEALFNEDITDEQAEEMYPGWYDRLKSGALDELDE